MKKAGKGNKAPVLKACPAYAGFGFLCFLFGLSLPLQVLAAGTGDINTSFKSIYNIIAAIVTSVGQLYLLWGVFEWATALNSQDGASQSMAFKRIAAGLVACMAPTIINMITIK